MGRGNLDQLLYAKHQVLEIRGSLFLRLLRPPQPRGPRNDRLGVCQQDPRIPVPSFELRFEGDNYFRFKLLKSFS